MQKQIKTTFFPRIKEPRKSVLKIKMPKMIDTFQTFLNIYLI